MTRLTTVRIATAVALTAMFMALIWRVWVFYITTGQVIFRPYGLDYGEGIVWQQAALMFTHDAYGAIDGFPALVFHYPPLYHIVARGFSVVSGQNMLLAGRELSIAATFLIALVVGLIVARAASTEVSARGRAVIGAGGALAVFCLHPVEHWAPLMRVDMVAILLAVTGFWLGLKALERPAWIYGAAVCFVAAVFTKQTEIAAPAALFALLLWRRPRIAIAGIMACTFLGLLVVGGLEWATSGGFLKHIFLYNLNRIEWRRLAPIAEYSPFFVLAAVFSIRRFVALQQRHRTMQARDVRDLAWLGLLFYAATSSLMVLTIAKSGSANNYLIEWLLVAVMLIASALADALNVAEKPRADKAFPVSLMTSAIGIPCVVAAMAFFLKTPDRDLPWPPERRAAMAQLSAIVARSSKPVISDDMVMLMQNNRRVMWEPSIFAELASKGVWDQTDIIRRIRSRQFQMFVTEGVRGDYYFDSRYNPAVADAIDAAYPIKRQLGGFTLHLPEKS
ncbi:glycosyltransferase 87 family protein [Sphingomonas sp.]|uniref:glycosyltransferase 87 family protein n=1 Tax=Sphingomonas sp. TaxID=28214 RepID=UPI0025F68C55|nr:glycosyltransferase 87 family protein [Sphingomonas sp.]